MRTRKEMMVNKFEYNVSMFEDVDIYPLLVGIKKIVPKSTRPRRREKINCDQR